MGRVAIALEVLGLTLAVACAWAPPAHAQTREARARAHFEAGRVYAEEGDYAAALPEFRAAYELSPRPALLYNIGLAAERSGRAGEAAEAYDAFVASGEAGELDAELRARIPELRREAERQQAAAAVATQAQTPDAPAPQPEPAEELPGAQTQPVLEATSAAPESGSGTPDWLPWAVVGAGGAVAIAGGVLLGVGLGDVSTVEDAAPGTDWSDVSDANDRAPTLTGVGAALLAVGAATAAGGLLWWSLQEGERSDALAVRVLPTGALVTGAF